MIVTLTPNPAVDYTMWFDALSLGGRSRYTATRLDPAGKGINVARMVRRLGAEAVALGFAGGPTGAWLSEALDREEVPHAFVPAPGMTRLNVTLLAGGEGPGTHLHGPGDAVGRDDVAALRDLVARHVRGASTFVLSGSLPPGMTPADAASLVEGANEAGAATIVDAERDVLRAALAASPSIVKPNRKELSEHLVRPLPGIEDVVLAARGLGGTVVATLGAEGAVGVKDGVAWHVEAPRGPAIRAVGAGDSFAAGLAVALERGEAFPDALRLAAACGAAAAIAPGTGLGARADVDRLLPRVRVDRR